jgi:hypothetical protein
MTAKVLEQALAEVKTLADADQEQIGRRMLSHVERLRRLREELDKDLRLLDASKGQVFSVEEFIAKKPAECRVEAEFLELKYGRLCL